jgi:hypothetical protein
MAGPDGKICVADTDNSRARLYAGKFNFLHLELHEPFRPMLFEQAAIAAQKQGADVLIVDNFAAEWAGPGGILEWHEAELDRMAGDNFQRREQLKMVVWGKVKPPHKHMLQRLYQLNMPVLLCCAAEKKIAMVVQTEGKDKGKVIPVSQGFQPIGDKDAAYAMTASLLLEDVQHPGVPRPIKALLPDLEPIIHLDRPLDEATGAAIAAWARGDKSESPKHTVAPREKEKPAPNERAGQEVPVGEETSVNEQQTTDPSQSQNNPDADKIRAGAKALSERFAATKDRAEHLALVRDQGKQIDWLKKHRLYAELLEPAVKESWTRTGKQESDLIGEGQLQ